MASPILITTVITPATGRALDLVDLATVKLVLNINDGTTDNYLRLLISWCSAEIKSYCNRVLVPETIKDEFWPFRDPPPTVVPGDLKPLQLSRWPIVAAGITELLENAIALVDGTDYRVDYDKGQLIRLDDNLYPRRWPTLPISVTFNAGYSPMDAPIIDAVTRMIGARWRARDRDPYLKQESIPGVREVQFWIPNGPTGNMTPDIEDILDNYRVPVIA